MLRRERQHAAAATLRANSVDSHDSSQPIDKRLLILNTIEDLKRSLEEQSIELCDLNANGDEWKSAEANNVDKNENLNIIECDDETKSKKLKGKLRSKAEIEKKINCKIRKSVFAFTVKLLLWLRSRRNSVMRFLRIFRFIF